MWFFRMYFDLSMKGHIYSAMVTSILENGKMERSKDKVK